METTTRRVPGGRLALLIVGASCILALRAQAVVVGQGSFDVTLGADFLCSAGGGSYTTSSSYDDRTFPVTMADGTILNINFSALGAFTSAGNIDCVSDQGGTFSESALNAAGDFQWTEITGEYVDRNPGISVGDPFPFVGQAHCSTTRQDDFQTLCNNFDFSFNGFAKAEAPDPQGFFRFYSGGFNLRATQRVGVGTSTAAVQPTVDGAAGDVPNVAVTFQNGVRSPGALEVTTLADAHGTIPAGVEFPIRGTTQLDHGSGPVPFFPGGDERFIDITTDATFPAGATAEVCLPLPRPGAAAAVRRTRVLHGEGSSLATRVFVDRTTRVDPTSGTVCATVSDLSKFSVVTTDVCGGGQTSADGLLTVAGGLSGKKTVVVDGLTDCTQYPAKLPKGLRQYCVPDADASPGQCTVSLTLGINRGACSLVRSSTTDAHSPNVQTTSYHGTLKQGGNALDLTPVFGPLIAALSNPIEATVGPVDVVLPATRKITTYKIKQQLTGIRPGTASKLDTDSDVLTVQCVDPAQF